MILVCLFQESKNIIFTCGDSKNNSWPSPLVIFSVPTRENNVFLLSFHRTVILHHTEGPKSVRKKPGKMEFFDFFEKSHFFTVFVLNCL
jgi:hypothetical protein